MESSYRVFRQLFDIYKVFLVDEVASLLGDYIRFVPLRVDTGILRYEIAKESGDHVCKVVESWQRNRYDPETIVTTWSS